MSAREACEALLERYNAATPEQRERGRRWYDTARRECRSIARDTGYSFRRVAAVLAITSPDAQLTQNLAWTRTACEFGGIGRHGRYHNANAPKVWRALYGVRPGDAVSGPKVTPFYRAICGDDDALVVDRWASFAAGGPRDVPRAADRRAIEQAYREAAERSGETVRDFQAIVWIQCRESTPDSRGTVRRYADIV